MATVLIVDDSKSDRKLAKKVVSKLGHIVVEAANGLEAIEMLDEYMPQLILLDVVMPEMDGFATCRAIRENKRYARIPIVLTTTKNTASDEFWGKKQGATAHLGKPYGPKDLAAVVEQYV
ncbi:MAG: response regulator [Sphaerospermopsis sp. SIO1G2]|nr:response regulator [Sphaerospermopsis sp. SIO1G2]